MQKKLSHRLTFSKNNNDQRMFNLIGQEAHPATHNETWLFQILPSLDNYLHAKKKQTKYQLFLSKDTDDKKSWNLMRQRAELATPNQKW